VHLGAALFYCTEGLRDRRVEMRRKWLKRRTMTGIGNKEDIAPLISIRAFFSSTRMMSLTWRDRDSITARHSRSEYYGLSLSLYSLCKDD
jgi:hypothetical protein